MFCANKSNDSACKEVWLACSLHYIPHLCLSSSKVLGLSYVNTLNMYVCFSIQKHNVGEAFGRETKSLWRETNFNYIPLNISFLCFHGVIVVLYCCSGLVGMLFQLIWNHVPCRLESWSILSGTKPLTKESGTIVEKC